MVKVINPTKLVVTARLSYAYIWEAHSFGDAEPKYSSALLIPKTDKEAIDALNAAIEAAKEEAKGKSWGGKIPGNLKLPIHDGDVDRPDDDAYAGMVYLNASSKDAPQIVDQKKQPITDPMKVYSGCWCNVSLNCRGYNFNGTKGVTFYLGNIQLVRDGEQLAGRTSAASDFDEVESEGDVFDEIPEGERPSWM